MVSSKKLKAKYVDGFLIVVPKKNIPAYKKISQFATKIWMKYGALDYYECMSDDVNIKFGLPFPKLANAKKNETVVFSYITYKSKSQRDSINKKVMNDPKMAEMSNIKMPFDVNKMSYGGFKVFVSE